MKKNLFKNDKSITAIVLAGGKSQRMGKTKALMSCPEGTLLERILTQIKPYFDEIIISVSEFEKHKFPNYKIVVDEQSDRGPLMGILTGLRASSNDINFVVACDIPDINIDFLKKILKFSWNFDIVVPVSGQEKFEPLFAVYHKRIIPVIEELLNSNILKIIHLFPKCKTKLINMKNNGWYRNLNTFKEYQRFIDQIK